MKLELEDTYAGIAFFGTVGTFNGMATSLSGSRYRVGDCRSIDATTIVLPTPCPSYAIFLQLRHDAHNINQMASCQTRAYGYTLHFENNYYTDGSIVLYRQEKAGRTEGEWVISVDGVELYTVRATISAFSKAPSTYEHIEYAKMDKKWHPKSTANAIVNACYQECPGGYRVCGGYCNGCMDVYLGCTASPTPGGITGTVNCSSFNQNPTYYGASSSAACSGSSNHWPLVNGHDFLITEADGYDWCDTGSYNMRVPSSNRDYSDYSPTSIKRRVARYTACINYEAYSCVSDSNGSSGWQYHWHFRIPGPKLYAIDNNWRILMVLPNLHHVDYMPGSSH